MRRKLSYDKDKPYEHAKVAVIELERRALFSIPVKFTLDEIMAQLIPLEHQKLLTAVKPLAKKHWGQTVSQSFSRHTAGVELRFDFDFEKTDIFPPLMLNTVFDGEVDKYVGEFYTTAVEFHIVNRAINWANKHVSFGALRHYWPSLVEMLKPDNPAREANSIRFKEPDNAGDWIRDIRQATTTIASAQCLPELQPGNNGRSLGLTLKSPTCQIPVL